MDTTELDSQFAESLEPIDFSVYPGGDDSSFHTRNDPNQPYQRDNIIERKGRVDIRCEHKDIIHGYYSTDNDDLCSLIIVEFRFHPNGIARRIKEAHVVIKFAAMGSGKSDPEVVDLYPNGEFSIDPTQQHEILVSGGAFTIGASGAGAQVGAILGHEKTTERDTHDACKVRGSMDLRGRNWGPKNSVSWTLLENATAKSGVVPMLRGAILLKRRDMEKFKSTVTIEASVDVVSKVHAVLKSDPKDDDVWYDPEREATNRLRKYDVENLGSFNLQSISDVSRHTLL